MEQNFKNIILRTQELTNNFKVLLERYQSAPVGSGRRRALDIQLKNTKKRLAYLHGLLRSRIIGEIIDVTYLYNNHTIHGQFVNLPDEEIMDYYSTLAKVKGVDIQIVEITRKKTFISDVPLD